MLNRHLLPLCVFVIMLAFLWRGMSVDPKQLPSAMLNKPIPTFTLQTLPDLRPATEKILLGKISVLHVWASWCQTCQHEQELFATLDKTNDYQLVGINYKDLQFQADLCLNKHNDLYTVTIFDFEGSLSMDLGVYGTPTTFIVDRNGIIRYRHVGALTKDEWNSQIIPIINKFS